VRDAMTRAANDPKVVGIVVTGGGRAFCAGADMNLLDQLTGDDVERSAATVPPRAGAAGDAGDEFGGRFPYVMTVDKPVIAAVNGAVAGMAFPFVLCCDLRIASPE